MGAAHPLDCRALALRAAGTKLGRVCLRGMVPRLCLFACLMVAVVRGAESGPGWFTVGPPEGRRVVLLAGDEEYRSEESLPMLAQLLAARHGFRCTVLLPYGPDGTLDPNRSESLGKPEAIDGAELLLLGLRFRRWPDDVMARFDAAMRRGVPVVALRTSTHAFQLREGTYLQYNNFGPDVLGAGWRTHWGQHAHEGTRAVAEAASARHPILRGVGDIFADTDVYEAYPPADADVLLRGRVLAGMDPKGPESHRVKKRSTDGVEQAVNEPAMAVAWTREIPRADGVRQRVFCTTMASASDLADANLRRLVVNAVFWGLGLEVPALAEVEPVTPYRPSPYAFNRFRKGVKSQDLLNPTR